MSEANKKSSKYNVTNPTKADHVIHDATGKKKLIPAGGVVESVELYDDEAEALKDTHKKMGDGNFISLSSASGGDSTGDPKPLPVDQLTRDPRPGDEPSKDKAFDPQRNPLPSQDPRNAERNAQGKQPVPPIKK